MAFIKKFAEEKYEQADEMMNICRRVKSILTGEIGPKLTLDYEEDARYVYPERIKLAIKELEKIVK